MKHRYLSVLLAVLLLLGLGGRTFANAARQLDAAEDAVEHQISAAEDALEQALQTTPSQTPSQSRITPEQAQSIALEHAGFPAEQVQYLRTEFEVDDRIPEYEVSFHEGRWEYEYEIHAETGEILSYSRDD